MCIRDRDNPEEAGQLAQPFYQIPINAKMIFDAAKARVVTYPNADHSKIAVIGYCFGGAQALNMARQESDLKGAVSFHGNLMTGVKPKNNKVKTVSYTHLDVYKRQQFVHGFQHFLA